MARFQITNIHRFARFFGLVGAIFGLFYFPFQVGVGFIQNAIHQQTLDIYGYWGVWSWDSIVFSPIQYGLTGLFLGYVLGRFLQHPRDIGISTESKTPMA